jgi:methylated-DNA-[protein]-cysteine S-methyltransferase
VDERTGICDSPIGPLALTASGGCLTGLVLAPRDDSPGPAPPSTDPWFEPVIDQLGRYFDGSLSEFDIPVRLRGSPFQRQVWGHLLTIPYGHTTSYQSLARAIGNPKAARAVGLANSRNPIQIVVPCHRLIGADGSLTGYAGGLDRKARLLELEGGRPS